MKKNYPVSMSKLSLLIDMHALTCESWLVSPDEQHKSHATSQSSHVEVQGC